LVESKEKIIENFRRDEDRRDMEFETLKSALRSQDLRKFLRDEKRKRTKRGIRAPLYNLSSTIGKIKSTHADREQDLQKTIAKVNLDKVILMKEKLQTMH
jgi:hypothetical protein